MRKSIIVVIFLMAATAAWAYRPREWGEGHSKTDPEESDFIATVRVVGLEMAEEAVVKEKDVKGKWFNKVIRVYSATLRVCEVIKPDNHAHSKYQAGSTFKMEVGNEILHRSSDIVSPKPTPPALRMHGTQNGYDLRIGQVYVLFFKDQRSPYSSYPFDLRSGPYSIFWVLPDNTYRQKGLRDYGDVKDGYDAWLKNIKKRADAPNKSIQRTRNKSRR